MSDRWKIPVVGMVALATLCGAAKAAEFHLAVDDLAGEYLDPIAGPPDVKWYQTLIYDSLVGLVPGSNELSAKTGIAESWEHSDDYKVWTFHLRSGVNFHNGAPVTAEDVKFSLDRAMGETSLAVNKATLAKVIDSIEVVDPATVRVMTKNPDSLLPNMLSESIGNEAMIVPKAYVEEVGEQGFRANPVGTGPFRFKEHAAGRYILLEAVDSHFAFGKPKFSAVRLSAVPETTARVGLLNRGEVDLVAVPLERVEEVQKAGFAIVTDPAQATNILYINGIHNKDMLVSDIRVREALNIAIDRDAINKALFAGMAKPAPYATATEASIGYLPEEPAYAFDQERARSLMAEAGCTLEKSCAIDLYSYPLGATFPSVSQTMEAIAFYWSQIGIKPNIINVPEYGPIRKRIFSQDVDGEITPLTAGGRVWAMPITYALHHSEGVIKSIQDPELDQMLVAALNEIDPTRREQLSHEVFSTIRARFYQLPIVEVPGTFAANPKTLPDAASWKMGPVVFDLNLESVLMEPMAGSSGN